MQTRPRPRRSVPRTALAALRRLDALAGPNGLDPYLAHLDRSWSSRTARARIVAVEHPGADAVSLTLRPNAAWRGFRAGQAVEVTVEIDGVHHRRWYSPTTSARRDDVLGLTVKVHPEGRVSRHLKTHARVGDVVGLEVTGSDFALPEPGARPADLLLVTGGSGHTPILSMLRTLADDRHVGCVTWLHYDRTPADVVVDEATRRRLRTLLPGLRTHVVHTRAPEPGEPAGHLTTDHLDAVALDWRERATWACGPNPLLAALRERYEDAGCGDRLRIEAFALAAPAPAADDPADPAGSGNRGTVTFGRSDRRLTDDGRALLVQAESAGLTPKHGCRLGICHTCTAPLVAGTVRDLVTGATTSASADDPGGCGIRLCVSAPVGDVALDL